jgi:nucleotide-binding universal stress UspA family protein
MTLSTKKRTNMKRILIALDYDPTAQKVAEAGFAMAKAMGAEVTLLHVMVNQMMYASAYADMGAWQIETLETLEALDILRQTSNDFLQKAKRHLGNKSINTINKEGDTAQQILQSATEISADCIVMGTHSQKWLENILMGSVTEEVLRKTTVPMFIIPTRMRN